MKNIRILSIIGTILCLLLLASCGPSNTVRLLPLKQDASVLPAPTSSTISVVQFADKRADKSSLGLRRDQSYFTSIDSAPKWLSEGIADKLSANGYKVTYARSMSEGVKGTPDYILTGSLESLNIKEQSATSFEVSMRVKYVLSDKDKKVVLETLTANQTRTTLPSNSAIESLLQNTLADIVNPMYDKVHSAVRK